MNKAGFRAGSGRGSGFTLIELIIAISASALVISAALFAWGRVGGHIAQNRRKALLHREAQNIAGIITGQLQRTPRLVSWHYYGVSCLSASRTDTISYEFYNGELLRNDTALALISDNSRIASFEVEIEESRDETPADNGLVVIRMTFEDDFDNRLEIIRQVSAPLPLSHDGATERLDWNF